MARDGVVVYTDAGLNREKDKESIGMAAIDSCGHFFNAFGTPYSICREGHNCWSTSNSGSCGKSTTKGLVKGSHTDAKNVIQMLQKNLITSLEIETICENVWQ